MIWRPRWRNVTTHTDGSPFNSQPAVRPMRLTFHVTEEPAADDAEALTVIRSILRPEYFEWLDTAGTSSRRLSIEKQLLGEDEHGVARVRDREGDEVGSAGFWLEPWRNLTATLR